MAIQRSIKSLKTLMSLQGLEGNAEQTLSRFASSYLSRMSKDITHWGKAETCRKYKEYYLIMRNISLDLPFDPLPYVKADKNGVPKVIKPLYPFLTGSPEEKRIALTIGRFYESIVVKPNPKLDPITEPGPQLDSTFLKHFEEFSSEWIRKVFHAFDPSIRFKVNSRQVSGPNGPAMLTAHFDAAALQGTPVWHAMKNQSMGTPFNWFFNWMNKQASYVDPTKSYKTGRLAYLSEPGGKTRIIAIGDYWSQLFLRPFHDILMKLLRRLETDGTWNQDRQAKRIAETATGDIYSYDLSSATDRFPFELQRIVFSVIWGKELSEDWKTIMTNREFHTPDGKTVRWEAGQPLGLYSSWAIFALTHHIIIEYCAKLEGFRSFKSYAVLGDDVVIWNSRVALRYKQMMNDIGVPINLSKSVVSRGHDQIEFAKRLFYKGCEITGVRFVILKESSHHMKMIPDLLRVITLRQWRPQWERLNPSYLNDRGKELLSVLITEWMYPNAPELSFGVTFDDTKIQALRRKVRELRIAQLVKQRDLIFEHLEANGPMDKLFIKWGIAVSPQQLGLSDDGFVHQDLHPVVYELNRRGEQVFELLESLFTLEDPDLIDSWDPLPVEYVPPVSNAVFFGDRNITRAKWHASLTLEAWKSLETLEAS